MEYLSLGPTLLKYYFGNLDTSKEQLLIQNNIREYPKNKQIITHFRDLKTFNSKPN